MTPQPRWKTDPDPKDYAAARSYLSLVADENRADKTAYALKNAATQQLAAKDILRSAQLTLLPRTDAHVRKQLKKIARGKKRSPVLLVHGEDGNPLTIADGYHRVCACYHCGDDTVVDARVGSWQS